MQCLYIIHLWKKFIKHEICVTFIIIFAVSDKFLTSAFLLNLLKQFTYVHTHRAYPLQPLPHKVVVEQVVVLCVYHLGQPEINYLIESKPLLINHYI